MLYYTYKKIANHTLKTKFFKNTTINEKFIIHVHEARSIIIKRQLVTNYRLVGNCGLDPTW